MPQTTKEKLLRKIAKKDPYIKTLDDAFKQAREIDRESSFVDAALGRYNKQNTTKIETQINELDDSFQDCDINPMSTRSTNRSSNGQLMDLSMDPLIDLQAGTAHTIHHLIPDQISETTIGTRVRTARTAKLQQIQQQEQKVPTKYQVQSEK